MASFDNLTYDKLIEICESLDDQSLNSLIRTSKKAYDTCHGVLDERREAKQLIEKEHGSIDFMLPHVIDPETKTKTSIIIQILTNGFLINQIDDAIGPNLPIKSPWILEGLKPPKEEIKNPGYKMSYISRRANLNTAELVFALKQLKSQGYMNKKHIPDYMKKYTNWLKYYVSYPEK